MNPLRRALLTSSLAWPLASQASPGYEWRPWPARRTTPGLVLRALDGPGTDLKALRGHAVLLNFWASWCEPCREELPSLSQLAARHADEGLVVLAVNVRESPDAVRRFVQQQGLALPVLLDTEGQAAQAYTPRIYPSTAFIGRDGRATGVLVGAIDWLGDEAARRVAALLATKDRAPAAAR